VRQGFLEEKDGQHVGRKVTLACPGSMDLVVSLDSLETTEPQDKTVSPE
jgi:hypothetical protein